MYKPPYRESEVLKAETQDRQAEPGQMARLGRFRVKVSRIGYNFPETIELLAAAQHGCVVLRCEMIGYSGAGGAYVVHATHPDFDEIDRYEQSPPHYECLFTRSIGGVIVRTFKRKENAGS